VFVRLFAEFVSGEMISLAVGDGRGRVGVGRKAVEFCGSIVRALWHGVLLTSWMLLSVNAARQPIHLAVLIFI
jgi:hypothetical protein